MTLLGSFRSDQLIQDLVSETDPAGDKARKLVNKIKSVGPKVISKVIDALAMSDKSHTIVSFMIRMACRSVTAAATRGPQRDARATVTRSAMRKPRSHSPSTSEPLFMRV